MSLRADYNKIRLPLIRFLDQFPESALKKYETELHRFVETRHPGVFNDIRTKREMTDDLREKMNAALKEFNETFTA